MKKETWLPVKDFEGLYEVSSFAKIRSVERFIVLDTHTYLKKQKELTQFNDGRGYLHVKLYDGKANPKSLTVHRIVAIAFVPNPNNLPEVNHIDGNKLNNYPENFEWTSRRDNIKHAYTFRDPATYKGSGNKNSKLTEEKVLKIREEYKLLKTTYKELALKNNVGITLIGYIINNKVWNHI